MTTDNIHLQEAAPYLAFAEALAAAARPLARSYFRTPLDVISKIDDSPVTIADRAIEKHLREMIEARFPDHGIYGEEFGVKKGDAFTWVLDPIDGTKSFITGFPLFGTLISLAYQSKPYCGVVDIPATGERWLGQPGGTTFAGKPARTSSNANLSDARFYTTSPDMFTGADIACFERLSKATRLRRFGGDCYIYGLLASGHCEIVLETGLQPYDYMALVPIVTGAGGSITDWQGNALSFHSDGRVLASANPKLHDHALTLLNR